MSKLDKVKNIIAFLATLFAEEPALINALMKFSPDYLIEKYERYIESTLVEHPWGLHPALRSGVFDRYWDKWSHDE